MTPERIQEIRAARAAITPGPWGKCEANEEDGGCSCGLIWSLPVDATVAKAYTDAEDVVFTHKQMNANADFIAAVPAFVDELLAELEAMQKRAEKAEGLLAYREKVLRSLTECRCSEAWTGRGLHAPECLADEGLLDEPTAEEIEKAVRERMESTNEKSTR